LLPNDDVRAARHSGFEQQLYDAVSAAPDHLVYPLRARLGTLRYVRRAEMNMQAGDLNELVAQLRRIVPAGSIGPGGQIIEWLELLTTTAIGLSIEASGDRLKERIGSQKVLFNTLVNIVEGVHRLQFQSRDLQLRLDLQGLDFLPFFTKME
jgi:hypothetical protein